MILTGRWLYKKHKQRQNNKIAQKDGKLDQASEAELSDTAGERLDSAPDEAKQSSLPPSYSRIEQDLRTTPVSILHPSSSHKSTASSPLSELSQPTEIHVHGKWIWVPDGSPLPSTLASQQTLHVAVSDGVAAELRAASPLKELPSTPKSIIAAEEDQPRDVNFIELDSKQLSASELDK